MVAQRGKLLGFLHSSRGFLRKFIVHKYSLLSSASDILMLLVR